MKQCVKQIWRFRLEEIKEDITDDKRSRKQRTDIHLEGWLKCWEIICQKTEQEVST
jgi:hypothetical protein